MTPFDSRLSSYTQLCFQPNRINTIRAVERISDRQPCRLHDGRSADAFFFFLLHTTCHFFLEEWPTHFKLVINSFLSSSGTVITPCSQWLLLFYFFCCSDLTVFYTWSKNKNPQPLLIGEDKRDVIARCRGVASFVSRHKTERVLDDLLSVSWPDPTTIEAMENRIAFFYFDWFGLVVLRNNNNSNNKEYETKKTQETFLVFNILFSR